MSSTWISTAYQTEEQELKMKVEGKKAERNFRNLPQGNMDPGDTACGACL